MAASIGQFWHVVNVDWTGFNACVTGRAGPNGPLAEPSNDVFFGCFVSEERRGVVVGIVAYIVNDLHWIEVFSAGVGGADILTASAGGACPSVDEIPPCEIGVVDGTEGLEVKFVQQHSLAVIPTCQRLHGGHWTEVVEEDVWERHHQVHVLGQRDEEQEHTDGQHVGPIGGDDDTG